MPRRRGRSQRAAGAHRDRPPPTPGNPRDHRPASRHGRPRREALRRREPCPAARGASGQGARGPVTGRVDQRCRDGTVARRVILPGVMPSPDGHEGAQGGPPPPGRPQACCCSRAGRLPPHQDCRAQDAADELARLRERVATLTEELAARDAALATLRAARDISPGPSPPTRPCPTHDQEESAPEPDGGSTPPPPVTTSDKHVKPGKRAGPELTTSPKMLWFCQHSCAEWCPIECNIVALDEARPSAVARLQGFTGSRPDQFPWPTAGPPITTTSQRGTANPVGTASSGRRWTSRVVASRLRLARRR